MFRFRFVITDASRCVPRASTLAKLSRREAPACRAGGGRQGGLRRPRSGFQPGTEATAVRQNGMLLSRGELPPRPRTSVTHKAADQRGPFIDEKILAGVSLGMGRTTPSDRTAYSTYTALPSVRLLRPGKPAFLMVANDPSGKLGMTKLLRVVQSII